MVTDACPDAGGKDGGTTTFRPAVVVDGTDLAAWLGEEQGAGILPPLVLDQASCSRDEMSIEEHRQSVGVERAFVTPFLGKGDGVVHYLL